MTKKGPLGTSERFYIASLHGKLSVDELCKKLDRAKKIVRDYIATVEKEEEETPSVMTDLIPSSNGSTIMTPAGSEVSDEIHKARSGKKIRSGCVTKIKKS